MVALQDSPLDSHMFLSFEKERTKKTKNRIIFQQSIILKGQSP